MSPLRSRAPAVSEAKVIASRMAALRTWETRVSGQLCSGTEEIRLLRPREMRQSSQAVGGATPTPANASTT